MKIKNIEFLKIKLGEDLYKTLSNFFIKNNIYSAIVIGIGALQNLNFGYYNQEKKQYITKKLELKVEIVSLIGNVSLKDNSPFLHAHILVSDSNGNVYGGHLIEGTKVFSCECMIFELQGTPKHRELDKNTGLFLWK